MPSNMSKIKDFLARLQRVDDAGIRGPYVDDGGVPCGAGSWLPPEASRATHQEDVKSYSVKATTTTSTESVNLSTNMSYLNSHQTYAVIFAVITQQHRGIVCFNPRIILPYFNYMCLITQFVLYVKRITMYCSFIPSIFLNITFTYGTA